MSKERRDRFPDSRVHMATVAPCGCNMSCNYFIAQAIERRHTAMSIGDLVTMAERIGMAQIRTEITSLVELLSKRKPKNILEIGSARGGSFYLWCMIADRHGKKISIDLPGGRYGGQRLTDPNFLAKRNETMRSWCPEVHVIEGDSHKPETVAAVAKLLGSETLDFLFIDGDHTYEGVSSDYSMYSDFVRSGGMIAFHDINDSELHRSQNVDVARLWKELDGKKVEFNARQPWAGIGVLLR